MGENISNSVATEARALISQFWNNDKKTLILRSAFIEILNNSHWRSPNWASEQIGLALKARARNNNFVGIHIASFKCNYRTLSRFKNGEPNALSKSLHKTGLLIALSSMAQDFEDDLCKIIKPMLQLAQDFETEVVNTAPILNPSEGEKHNSESDVINALKFIGGLIGQSLESLTNPKRQFFPTKAENKNVRESYFISYRYDVEPGFVTKSFTRFHAPNDNMPICRFDNFYADNLRKRVCSGIVVPTSNGAYLLGDIDHGAALKVMAFRPLNVSQPFQEGLILSFLQQILAARICMVATEITDHAKVNIGRFPVTDLDKELEQFSEILRNRVKFVLERKIIDRNGQEVKQGGVVELVRQLLDDDPSKAARLRYADNEAVFNPADTSEYTYNSALTMPNN